MNKIVKVFLILGFVFLTGGIVIFYEIFRYNNLHVPGNSAALELLALSFWYIEPIIGVFLIFASSKKMTKFCGAFFLIAVICAWVNYFYLK